MLFNSIEFAVFLPVVFLLYWFVANKNLKIQNILLLLASYFFYGWWDWRFLFLLAGLSLLNFLIGNALNRNEAGFRRKAIFYSGLMINVGALCIFKYFNFFIDSFIDLASLLGYDLPRSSLKIILPLGISFYIFLSLSYLIDIYNRKMHAGNDLIEVLLTLGFFPIILAGPIQRPSSLLPQIRRKREFDYNMAADGLKQILWGLFVKVAIADNIAIYANSIFDNYQEHSGSTLLIGAVYYAVQIYADFSGYSNIAIGTASLFGFRLMQNFAYPYFARDITDFWRRWHISLTTWFRDYIFLPLSVKISSHISSDRTLLIKSDIFIYAVASIVTWLLTGLWHGANYTFIVWGMIHGMFLIMYRWQMKPRKKIFKKLGISNQNLVVVVAETLLTISVVTFAWIFFRSVNLGNAVDYISGIFSKSLLSVPALLPKKILALTFVFFLAEWLQRDKLHPLMLNNAVIPKIVRWGMYYTLVIIIILLGGSKQEFIYFQF
jgi:D-alanyl-lipoteichoic acid acyltransferase DltB (MBOAT superfamily)